MVEIFMKNNFWGESWVNGFHTTTINNSGEPTTDDIMAVAAKAGLNRQRAVEIMQEVDAVLLS